MDSWSNFYSGFKCANGNYEMYDNKFRIRVQALVLNCRESIDDKPFHMVVYVIDFYDSN